MIGKCRLCLGQKRLLDSHIIPKFVFRWKKKSSGSDRMRFAKNINRPEQDGFKLPFLCADCELQFSKLEGKFNSRYFVLATQGALPSGTYSQWLSMFLASVVWRAGQWRMEAGDFDEYSENMRTNISIALEIWRTFLISAVQNPGKCELHLLPVGQFSNLVGANLPVNWNRYLARYVEYDFVRTNNEKFCAIFVKMGPVAVFGHIHNEEEKWIGSKVAVQHGSFVVDMKLPPTIVDYLADRARKGQKALRSMSPEQKEKVRQRVNKNLDRVAFSGMFAEMQKDYERFGPKIFEDDN